MRVAVLGAGAIGGFIAAALARSGADVAVVARGPHLEAIRARGLRVRSELGDFAVNVRAADDLRQLGTFDYILLTFKAHSWPAVLPQLEDAVRGETPMLTLQNGVPFWFLDGQTLESVDPGGRIAAAIPRALIMGGVVHASGHIAEPGTVVQSGGRLYFMGELDGARSERVALLSRVFEDAGLTAPVESDIRAVVWRKLLGNLAFNPVSALTRATMGTLLADPAAHETLREIVTEGIAVGRAFGIETGVDADQRLTMARRSGDVKTSMLQDLEAGKRLELEPIAGAVIELAHIAGLDVPRSETIYALARALDAGTPVQ